MRSREHLLFIGAPFKLPVHQARLVLCQPFLSECAATLPEIEERL